MKERLSVWWRSLRAGRLAGIAAMPGQSSTIAGGKWSSLKSVRIDWEKLYRKSFVYNSVAALICGYFAADLLVAGMTPWFPPTEAPRPRLLQGESHNFPYYANLLLPKGRPNLFNEKGLVPDNDEGGPADLNGPPVKTSLPLNLTGVIVVRDPKKSVASIEDKGANATLAVRIHEPITRDTEVVEITEQRVVFINNATGRREYVELPEDASKLQVHGAAPAKTANGLTFNGGNHVGVERKALVQALTKDWNILIQQARCDPHTEGGKIVGFLCKEIVPGSIFETLGLKDGDIVTAMDGQELNNVVPLMGKLAEMKEGRVQHLSITVNRNGAPNTTYFDFN